jgi:hypothetical protein
LRFIARPLLEKTVFIIGLVKHVLGRRCVVKAT